jgi:hypothetical protein
MRWILPLGIALAISSSAGAQEDKPPVTYPNLPTFVHQPNDFVPSGWKTVAIKIGDLDSDKRSDVAVLMRMTDPANIERLDGDRDYKADDTNPYLLAVGLARQEGYALAASNHSLLPAETAPIHGDDPPDADTVKISHGVLTIYIGHLRGYDQIRFRWNGKAFALVGYDCTGISGGSISGLSANYLTRIARVERGEVGNDKMDFWTVRIRPDKRPLLDHIDWGFDAGTEVDGTPLAC